MPNAWDAYITQELERLRDEGLTRTLAVPLGWIDLSTNDYLNLSRDPRVIEASCRAARDFGTGARSSRLMSGNLEVHEALEAAIARATGKETCLIFGSGFLANLGILTALLGRGDTCFADRLNHASLVDGMRFSQAKFFRYKHNSPQDLHNLMQNNPIRGRALVVSDSVFSMDGDIAVIPSLVELAREYDALSVIDEAHAFGIMGREGGGWSSLLPAELKPDIVVGTLSKALGSYGGFVACSRLVRSFLINRARSFIFSTALPPAAAAAALESLRIVSEEKILGVALMRRVEHFHGKLREAGVTLPACMSQILPIPIGDNNRAVRIAKRLREQGIVVTAIRPPTVPERTARLRLSVSLAHTIEELDKAADCIARCLHEEEAQ
jgi:8-amino-7-oxononanoate synthase